MAIASCNVSIVSRGKGHCVTAGAAYRAGEKIHDERTGLDHDYTRRRGIVYAAILTPSDAPDWAHNREYLWNAVEQAEKQNNAQLAREIRIALPKELTPQQNIQIARAYAQTFVNDGMIADVTVHDKRDGNPHAHILLTMRPLSHEGKWLPKCHREYVLDSKGEKIKLANGEYKSHRVNTTDWDTPEKLVEWRKNYESIVNYHLEKAGRPERIDVRSYEAQGIDREATIHLGHYAHQLEKKGIPSVRGDINRQIEARNHLRQAIDKELAQLEAARQRELARWEAEKWQPQKPAPLHHERSRDQHGSRYEEKYRQTEAERAAEAKRQETQHLLEAQREAAKRHQRKYTRPHEPQRPARLGRQKNASEYERLYEQPHRQQPDRSRESELPPPQPSSQEVSSLPDTSKPPKQPKKPFEGLYKEAAKEHHERKRQIRRRENDYGHEPTRDR